MDTQPSFIQTFEQCYQRKAIAIVLDFFPQLLDDVLSVVKKLSCILSKQQYL